jgi:hypothetical protein
MRPPYDGKLAFAGLSTSSMNASGHEPHGTIHQHTAEGSTAMAREPLCRAHGGRDYPR